MANVELPFSFNDPGLPQRDEKPMPIETLILKIQTLATQRLQQVEDFVDFLKAREEDRAIVYATATLSTDAFHAVWDNPDDAEYDRL